VTRNAYVSIRQHTSAYVSIRQNREGLHVVRSKAALEGGALAQSEKDRPSRSLDDEKKDEKERERDGERTREIEENMYKYVSNDTLDN